MALGAMLRCTAIAASLHFRKVGRECPLRVQCNRFTN